MATEIRTGREPNAQNSELDPMEHPSGARIEKMMNDDTDIKHDGARSKPGEARPEKGNLNEPVPSVDKGAGPTATGHKTKHGSRYISPEDPAEGGRDEFADEGHRMDADDRSDI